jgi:aminobenzoyl-glutamate utilization protein B
VLPNDALAQVAQRNLEEAGGFSYTVEEKRFAEELQKSLPAGGAGELDSTASIRPLRRLDPNDAAPSTDVGDVSLNVPTIGFRTATFVPGVVAHTWQAAASAGMSIGQKGMIVAARALAQTGADLFADRRLVLEAKADFQRQTNGRTYQSVIPAGQKPPLDLHK